MIERVFSDFGVQPVLLLAQIVNFLVLFLILRKFLYPPIIKILEARKNLVIQNQKNADEIGQRLLAIDDETEEKRSLACKEAQKIIETALNTADVIIAKAHKTVQSDIDLMLEQARCDISQQRENMKKELSAKFSDLVIAGVEKITKKIVDSNDQKTMIEQQLQDLDNKL
jgi:F-type H+-transporting ATPase subunit b